MDWLDTALKARGKKTTGYLQFGQRADGSAIGLPVIVVAGKEPGPTIAIDGCVHGDEYEGLECAIRVTQQVDPAKLKGTIIAVPALNPMAFNEGQRVSGGDQKFMAFTQSDMNRVFPGHPDAGLVDRAVHVYGTRIVAKSDLVITFHGGGNMGVIGPFVIFPEFETGGKYNELELCKLFNTKQLWARPVRDGNLMTYCSRAHKVSCIGIEIGGESFRYPDRQHVHYGVEGILNIMTKIGMVELPYQGTRPAEQVVIDLDYIKSRTGGLWTFNVMLDEPVTKGQTLGYVEDIFGNRQEEVTAYADGLICGVRTTPKVQTGDWLAMIGTTLA
jgi:predicted deacylase